MGYTKVVQSGNFLEIYEFENELPKRRNNFRKRVKRIFNPYRRRRPDNVRRLRGTFVRLIRSNLTAEENPTFLTLTMREIVDVKDAYRSFSHFMCALRRKFGRGFRYIGVPEFQKRGAVHFHILIWGFPDEIIATERKNRLIAEIWGQGYIDFIKTDGNIKLAYYFGKYMSKAVYNDRLNGQKAYVASRNVLRPLSLSNSLAFGLIDDLWAVDKSVVPVEKIYDTIWLGRCIYKRYYLIPQYEYNHNGKNGHQGKG